MLGSAVADARLGPARVASAYAWKSLAGAGASLALVLSEQLTASGVITVPLNIKIADVERPNQLPEVPPGVQVGAPPAGFRVQ